MSNAAIREVIKNEYRKCSLSATYFIKKYVMIQHPTRGRILFKLFPYQEEALQQFQTNNKNIVLKSRQMGISTLCAAYILWLMIFHSDKNCLIISKTQDAAKEVVTKVRFANDNLPSWLRVESTEDNRLSLRLKNGSQVKSVSSSKDSARSGAISLLIMDEAAFMEYAEDIWIAAQPTLSTGGQAVVLSTPNGTGNWFHKMWVDGEAGKNGFNTIKFKWNLHPERDQTWRDEQTKNLGVRESAQECFDKDTIIYTKKGPRKISNVLVGDEVLTHNGRFMPVTRLYKNQSDTRKIKSKNNLIERYVTPNHPFLTESGWKAVSQLTQSDNVIYFPKSVEIDNRVDVKFDIFEKSSPKHFKKVLCAGGDKFFINDRKHKIIHNRYIKLNYEFGYILGLYLSEGSGCRLRKTYNFNYKTESGGWPSKIQEIITEQFGINSFKIRNIDNCGHLSICSEIFSNTIDLFCHGKDCYTKKLTKCFYENINEELVSGVVDGLFRGDGCLKKEYNKTFSSTSTDLIYDVVYLLNLLKIHNFNLRQSRVGGQIGHINGRTFVYSPQWEINIRKTGNISVIELSDLISVENSKNNLHSIILSTESNEIEVFNIEVLEDNSYVTEHGVVHNCDCDFSSSGNTVVKAEDISYYEKLTKDPIEKRRSGQEFWIWEYALSNKSYMVVADVARGDGTDFNAFHILDLETLEQVAEYEGKMSTKDYGRFLVAVATEYNSALLVIENATIGWATIQEVIDLGYENLFYNSSELLYVDVDAQMTNKIGAQEKRMVPGFTMSGKSRPLIISKFELSMHQKEAKINSTRLIEQLKTFIWKGSKAEAASGYNDDIVMSYGTALWIRDTALRLRTQSIELNKAMLNGIGSSTANGENGTPPQGFGGVYRTANMPAKDPWNIQIGNRSEDLTWLIR